MSRPPDTGRVVFTLTSVSWHYRRLHGHRYLKGATACTGRAAPLVAVFGRQFAGGRSVMAMVPVKISSLMMKTIAVT